MPRRYTAFSHLVKKPAQLPPAALVVPSLLSLLHAPPAPEDPTRERRGLIEMIMSRISTASLRRPWLVLGFAGVSAVIAGYMTSYVRVDTSLLDQFATDDPVFEAVQLLEREFEGVRPLDVTLSSKRAGRMFEPEVLRAIHRVTDWAAKQRAVIRASDVTEPIAGSWAAMSNHTLDVNDALRNKVQIKAITQILSGRDATILHPLLTPDGARTRLRIKLTDVGSHNTKLFVAKVKTKLGQELSAFPDIKASFGGDAYLTSSGLDAVVADLSGSVLVAALVIFLLLAVLLRDFKLALLAIPANLLPQVWTMAWMVARGISLSAATAIIFSLSIGLAVDGSIHLVSRFQGERARHPHHQRVGARRARHRAQHRGLERRALARLLRYPAQQLRARTALRRADHRQHDRQHVRDPYHPARAASRLLGEESKALPLP